MIRVRTKRQAEIPCLRGRRQLKLEMSSSQCGREDGGISLGVNGFLIARLKRLVPDQVLNGLNQAIQRDALWKTLN
jgi:hypothetical protein